MINTSRSDGKCSICESDKAVYKCSVCEDCFIGSEDIDKIESIEKFLSHVLGPFHRNKLALTCDVDGTYILYTRDGDTPRNEIKDIAKGKTLEELICNYKEKKTNG